MDGVYICIAVGFAVGAIFVVALIVCLCNRKYDRCKFELYEVNKEQPWRRNAHYSHGARTFPANARHDRYRPVPEYFQDTTPVRRFRGATPWHQTIPEPSTITSAYDKSMFSVYRQPYLERPGRAHPVDTCIEPPADTKSRPAGSMFHRRPGFTHISEGTLRRAEKMQEPVNIVSNGRFNSDVYQVFDTHNKTNVFLTTDGSKAEHGPMFHGNTSPKLTRFMGDPTEPTVIYNHDGKIATIQQRPPLIDSSRIYTEVRPDRNSGHAVRPVSFAEPEIFPSAQSNIAYNETMKRGAMDGGIMKSGIRNSETMKSRSTFGGAAQNEAINSGMMNSACGSQCVVPAAALRGLNIESQGSRSGTLKSALRPTVPVADGPVILRWDAAAPGRVREYRPQARTSWSHDYRLDEVGSEI